MMKKRYIGAAVACALAMGAFSGTALATPTDVGGGVYVDFDSPLNLQIQALNLRETAVANPGDKLTGYGQIASINGDTGFCHGCDLTFTFDYTVQAVGASGSGNPQVVFDGGNFKFYVSPQGTFNILDPSSASSGNLGLTMAGHAAPRTGFNESTTGTLYSNITGTLAQPTHGSSGDGLLDVTGGSAAHYFDTDLVADGIGGLADFSLTSEFQQNILTGCTPTDDLSDMCAYTISGSGTLIQKPVPVAVPEPATIGMMGLGLGFLALALRRRRKESDDRA